MKKYSKDLLEQMCLDELRDQNTKKLIDSLNTKGVFLVSISMMTTLIPKSVIHIKGLSNSFNTIFIPQGLELKVVETLKEMNLYKGHSIEVVYCEPYCFVPGVYKKIDGSLKELSLNEFFNPLNSIRIV